MPLIAIICAVFVAANWPTYYCAKYWSFEEMNSCNVKAKSQGFIQTILHGVKP